jgi:RNA polymerase sigma factor (sigma-70 family)
LNERDLLSRVGHSDRQAFIEFYNLFKDRVYSTAFSYLRQTEDAEEITQDVFLQINRSARLFDGRSSVNTWVYKITVSKCLDRLRYLKAKKRFGIFTAFWSDENDDKFQNVPDSSHHGLDADHKEDISLLLKAIDHLPETQKTALILTQLENLKGKDAAEIMGVTAKAVEGLIQRAKANLRKELEKIYDNQRKSFK